MNSTAIASIILGIISIILSVLLGKKSGQKEAAEEQLEGIKEELEASKQETQKAQENALQAQKTASDAKSQLSKSKVLEKQTAIEQEILNSAKDKVIENLENGAKRDSEMRDLSYQLDNARERNDFDAGMEVMRKLAERAIALGMTSKSSDDDY